MLPAGKYVVEVVLPPGYELVKEEDKNILIGDNFIAPVTQEFRRPGGSIFIHARPGLGGSPVRSSGAGYNAQQRAEPHRAWGSRRATSSSPRSSEPVWPCVGEMRIVPDYMSIFPQALEVAPFAGATRPLCDRKEVTLTDQMAATAKFYIFTSTHIASHVHRHHHRRLHLGIRPVRAAPSARNSRRPTCRSPLRD